MTEEVQVAQENAPATEQENVAPQTEVIEAKADESNTQEEKKSFTQAELDKIIQKEKAKAEARAERRALKAYAEKLEQMQTPKPVQEAPRDNKPRMDQFDNVEDYVEAVSEWKIQQREQEASRSQQEEHGRQLLSKTEKMYSEAAKLDDSFDRQAFDELPLTPAIAQAIIDSDSPAKVMIHLHSNPEEVERISRLSPARQAAEIGKIESKLSSAKEVKVSNAPAPIKPVGSKGGSNVSLASASMEDYIALRKQQGARWAR